MNTLTADIIREFLKYYPGLGIFVWNYRDRKHFKSDRDYIRQNARWAGKPALTANHGDGYLAGIVNGVHILAHRAAYLHFYGWLPEEIDHIDGDKANNRIGNLRASDPTVNRHNACKQSNNTSGVNGVCYVKRTGRWSARVGHRGTTYHLGQHDTIESAEAAVRAKRAEIGEFTARHGR